MNNLVTKEYLGSNIEFKFVNGKVYANANSMAKAFENGSQKLKDWKRSSKTQELIKELNEINGVENSHSELIISESGTGTLNGTWIEENLMLDFAQYLNVKFKVWCNTNLTTLIREGSVTLKSKTEEEMILELFPSTDSNLALLVGNTIRENKTLKKELTHKEDVIIGLVDDIDLTTKRQRITQIVRHGSKNNHQERYNMLYKEFSMKYHCDLNRRMETYNENNKPKVRNKMDYIDKVMNKIPELYEIACKIFENDIEKLKKEWDSTIKGEVI